MGAAIDEAKRAAAVADYKQRKAKEPRTSVRSVAVDHGVGEASLKRWLWRERELGSVAPTKHKRRGPFPKLSEKDRDAVVAMVLAEPALRLYEVASRMSIQVGFNVSEATVRRALRSRSIGKRRLVREKRVKESAPEKTRYKSQHRRKPESSALRRAYPSDFTNAEWEIVGPLWEEEAVALPSDHSLRDVLNAIRYIGSAGCPWRFLPHDFPPFQTVYAWFERWARDGTQERVNVHLRRRLRRRAGREDTPSLLIIDSQSVKTREAGEGIGYDGGKKVKGRKRHIAVDTMGLPWLIAIHAASIPDRDGIDQVVPSDISTILPRLEVILADGGYQGRAERRTEERTGVPLKIARRRGDTTTGEWANLDGPPPSKPAGFQVIPQRWIVERSNSWFSRKRRLTTDFERTTRHSAAWYGCAIQSTMLTQLAG